MVNKVGNAIRRVEKISHRFNAVAITISGVFLLLIMLYIVSDSVGRFILHPVIGTIEIVESMLAFAIFLGMAATLTSDSHIRVPVIVNRLSPRWQYWLELFSLAAGFALTLLMAYRSFGAAIHSYEIREAAGRAYIYFSMPIYPAKFALAIGISLFCAQFLIQFLSRLFSRSTEKNAEYN